jgi:hypothetical protein
MKSIENANEDQNSNDDEEEEEAGEEWYSSRFCSYADERSISRPIAKEFTDIALTRFTQDMDVALDRIKETAHERMDEIERKVRKMERFCAVLEGKLRSLDIDFDRFDSLKERDDDDVVSEEVVTNNNERVEPPRPIPNPIPIPMRQSSSSAPPPAPPPPPPPPPGRREDNRTVLATQTQTTKKKIEPQYEKYHKMLMMGVPEQAIRNKIKLDGLDDRNVVFY